MAPRLVQRARRQETLLVGSLGESDHHAIVPVQDDRRDGDGAEGKRTEDVTQKICLDLVFGEFISSSAY